MNKHIALVFLALILVACGDDEIERNDTDDVVTPVAPVTNQADDEVVVETLQNSVESAPVEAEEVYQTEESTESEEVTESEKITEPVQASEDDLIKQLKSMANNVSEKTTELVDGAKLMGQEVLENSQGLGETVVKKTESAVGIVKKVSKDVIDKSKEVGAAVATKTSEVVENVENTGSEIINKGKSTIYGKANDKEPAIQDSDNQSTDQKAQEATPSEDETTIKSDGQTTQVVPMSMTKKALSELVIQLEHALASMEKAASQAKKAAANLSQGLGEDTRE